MDLSEAEEASRLFNLYQSKIKTLIFDCFEVPEETNFRNVDLTDPKFCEAVLDVAAGLDAGDISECLSSNVKRVSLALKVFGRLEEVLPGLLTQVVTLGLLKGKEMKEKASFIAKQDEILRSNGFYDAWKKMIEAGHSPKKKDYLLRQIEFYRVVNGGSQIDAIREMAKQTGRDQESIGRVVRRSKKRKR